ncbi:WD40 repeat-like protein [Leucogyrophana mollusca]|uniref:WD40 repeat-like protein n=1 Tax=Leucogyrophana mollusca TaxID=85980 RepID=A0ACB8B1J0_9AGAM|nr:WD40 repeat-like protein [Leucogyrophana mollusca]
MSSPAESSSSVDHISHPLTKVTKVFKGHTDLVTSVAYFPDGRHIASGSWDKTIRIWNVKSAQQEGEALEHNSRVKSIAIAPGGGKIAARVACRLIVWDVVKRKRVQEVKMGGDSEQDAHALIVAFSPDSRRIATASSMSALIELWDAGTGSLVRELQQHPCTMIQL